MLYTFAAKLNSIAPQSGFSKVLYQVVACKQMHDKHLLRSGVFLCILSFLLCCQGDHAEINQLKI